MLKHYLIRICLLVCVAWPIRTAHAAEISPEEWESRTYIQGDDPPELRTLEDGLFRVLWYEGDVNYAQSILDVANRSVQRVQSLLDLTSPGLIEIIVYPNLDAMQLEQDENHDRLMAGFADYQSGTIFVAVPPGPEGRLIMEQRVPHELMHVMLARSTGLGYDNLPIWLREGLASTAELYPNPDFQALLLSAYDEQRLFPVSSLCLGFPPDPAQRLLAYAQSESFTRYLYHRFGRSGLQLLVNQYADGMDCETGAQVALGIGLDKLEADWRQDAFGEDVVQSAWTNFMPWLTILVLVIGIPLIIIAFTTRRMLRAKGEQAA